MPDLLPGKNKIELDILTLVNLMLKYSCNSSTAILVRKLLPKRPQLEEIAKKELGLKKIKLVDKNGQLENLLSLEDLFKVIKQIFSQNTSIYQLIQKSLRDSTNRYYLFDQLAIKILGSKTGTISVGGYYYIGNIGMVEIKNKRYFMGAIVKRKKIQPAVQDIREIGRQLFKLTQKSNH